MTSKQRADAGAYSEFLRFVDSLEGLVRTARRNRNSIATHPFYARKSAAAVGDIRRTFARLRDEHGHHKDVTEVLVRIEAEIESLRRAYPNDASGVADGLRRLHVLAKTELAPVLPQATGGPKGPAFLPSDILPRQLGILREVLREANICYEGRCYNASAAMLRRLVETLIVESFLKLGLTSKIQTASGDFVTLRDLVEIASHEKQLALTKTTRNTLPQLKFFGDLGVHNRKALVRKGDLDRIHNATRGAVEELARVATGA